MKKGKHNFKVLTKTETNKVKGGSVLSGLLQSVNDAYQQAQSMANPNCPPPEPPETP